MSNSKIDSFYMKGNDIGVLLLHGYTGSPENMRGLGEKLSTLGYTVYAPLLEGHGHSFRKLMETDVHQWYDSAKQAAIKFSTNVSRFYVMGLSMGGAFAVKLAQEFDVIGLVTFNAPLLNIDMFTDLLQFRKEYKDDPNFQKIYLHNRMKYSDFVHKIGQIDNLKQISCPIMINQGVLDSDRYKLSSNMLMNYTSSSMIVRGDYPQSGHMLLEDGEEEQVYKNLIRFMDTVEKKTV